MVALFATVLSFVACEDDAPGTSGNPSNTCNTLLPNKLSATVSGAQFCADSVCIADFGTELYINATTMDGRMLNLFIDSVQPGTYTMGADANSVLYVDMLGLMSFSTDVQPGELVITSHDTATNHVKGRFNVIVSESLMGATTNISSGSFDVFYLE